MTIDMSEKDIELAYIEEQMSTSYINYAMSVIVGRALPDVRDGLKPVHRRILYAMHEANLTPDKPFRKSATVVGDVLGKYHPHGDTAVYDTMVRMAQDFSLRYPLINGQGNFGSIDGDNAAAYRYTEARLEKISMEMLADIEKNTVNFTPNFDGSREEPIVLPSTVPNLLVNGSTGIAVGMATNIPPHNLGEVCDAVIHIIDHPDCAIADLMKIMPGPDFPTAGLIFGDQGIKEAYETGRGRVSVGAYAGVEPMPGNREAIIITEIPFAVNKTSLIEKIADLVRDKKVEGISDIRDESDREGMRIVIELKRDANPQVILNKLYKYTQMRTTFGIIMLALVNNQPMVMDLKTVLNHYINHRREVIRRRSEYLLAKAEAEAHIKEGLIKAIGIIDEVIALIRKSKDRAEAHAGLVKKFKFTDEQAKAILDLRLHRLTSLEINQLQEELAELLKEIERLKFILDHEKEVLGLIKHDLAELKKKYGDVRRTRIIGEMKEYKPEDFVKQEDVVITISHQGYIKSQPLAGYRLQKRGGRGVTGMDTRETDFVEHLFIASTHDYILFFTDDGRCYWLKVYDIPQASRIAKGKAIVNMINIEQGAQVTAFVPVSSFDDDHYLVMATEQGIVKKTVLSAYGNPRATGIIACGLNKGDKLIEVRLTDGNNDVILATQKGLSIRFHETDVRNMGRTATGVKGINLGKGDKLIGMVTVSATSGTLLVATHKGYGKRTELEEYRVQSRGGKGIITLKATDKTGPVVAILEVVETNELMITTKKGIVIRTPVKGISVIGRNTQGVRLIKLDAGDEVMDVARLALKADGESADDEQEELDLGE